MTDAIRPLPSQPLSLRAAKPASGGKNRAHRVAPTWMTDKPLYRIGKSRLRGQTRVGAHILGQTIGNALAYQVSGSQDTSQQANQTPSLSMDGVNLGTSAAPDVLDEYGLRINVGDLSTSFAAPPPSEAVTGDQAYQYNADGTVVALRNSDGSPVTVDETLPSIGGDGTRPKNFTRDSSGNLVYTSLGINNSSVARGGPSVVFSSDDADLRVSDPYGAPRDGGATMHAGIDLATGGRKGIYALSQSDGTVIRVGATGYGPNAVFVESSDHRYFTYGHLALHLVNTGDHVVVGEEVGEIGTLGNSSGIHLHLQVTTGSPFTSSGGKALGVSVSVSVLQKRF